MFTKINKAHLLKEIEIWIRDIDKEGKLTVTKELKSF